MDDFGVKYIGEEHARHLMDVLKLYYKMEENWKGQLYCGITLNWNYYEGYVEISMPNYVTKKLRKYGYKPSKRQQYFPYEPNPIRYGKILTTLYMKRSPLPSMTMTRNSSSKY